MKETGGAPSETPKDITKILELTVSKLFEFFETSEGAEVPLIRKAGCCIYNATARFMCASCLRQPGVYSLFDPSAILFR